MKRILLVAGLLAGATSIAAAQPAARVDSVFARFARADAPGCVVGVSRNGRDVLTRAYGAANLEFAAPLTANSILEAGSVSKQFTAAAIALLAAEGKLSIDDPVRRHVPELPAVMEPIRLRHMLSHTSGLRDWGRSRRSPVGRADCARIRTRTCSTSSRASRRSIFRRAPSTAIATAATTCSPSSSSA